MTSIKMVAARAGVSTATVSRVLNGHPSCSPDMVKKVTRAVQELGYRPNSIAKSLRLQKAGTLITVLNDIRNPVFSGMIKGMEDVAYQRGYSLLIGNTGGSLRREEGYLRELLSRKADGLVLITPRVELAQVTELAAQLPLVLINEPRAPKQVAAVGIDDYAAQRELTQRVIQMGHRRIAYLMGDRKAGIAARRKAGVEDAMAEAGLSDSLALIPAGATMQHGANAMLELLESGFHPSCVLCYNDEVALGAMVCAMEKGIATPAELSFCGFDDIPTASLPWPSLSTVRQPTYEVGEAAAKLLIGLIEGEAPPAGHLHLAHSLELRSSTQELHP